MRSIGFQLYSARESGSWSRLLGELAGFGYTCVEGYGALYAEQPALADLLAEHGLRMPTGHFALESLEDDLAVTLATASRLGCRMLFVPFIVPADRPRDLAGWRALGKRVSRIGERVRGEGFTLGWHNHEFEFQPLPDGSLPMQVLLGEDEELDWEADIAWVVRSGADPLACIERLGERIAAVHVKDIAPAGENLDEDGWADPGGGTMAWPELLAAILAGGRGGDSIHWIAEHDRPSDVSRFAQCAQAAFSDWCKDVTAMPSGAAS